jgi:hypothetical protein
MDVSIIFLSKANVLELCGARHAVDLHDGARVLVAKCTNRMSF